MGYNGFNTTSVRFPAADDNTQLYATRIKSMSGAMRKPVTAVDGVYEPFSIGVIQTSQYDKIVDSVGTGEGYQDRLRVALFAVSPVIYTVPGYSVAYQHVDVSNNELKLVAFDMGSMILDSESLPFIPTDGLLLGVDATIFTSNPPLEGSLKLKIIYERVHLTSEELLSMGCVC